MIEIDEYFTSREDWLEYAERTPAVYDASAAAAIAGRVLEQGFTEPLTGRRVAPDQIRSVDANWREGLESNGIISRGRAVLALLAATAAAHHPSLVRIFATEAVTSLALLLRGIYPRFLGSEFATDRATREALYPIPHQDLTSLDLPSGRFDIVTTNEVLEHVPDLDAALREIARVLKPGGMHIGTHPFLFMSAVGDLRTTLVDGQLVHLKEPEYHGNPVAPGGSLVFETPGWDIVARARAAGFSEAGMRFVASESQGVLTENLGVFVFCARR